MASPEFAKSDAALAAALGISRTTVAERKKLPAAPVRTPSGHSIPAWRAWLASESSPQLPGAATADLADIRAQLIAEQHRKLKLANDEREALLIPKAEAIAILATILEPIRSTILHSGLTDNEKHSLAASIEAACELHLSPPPATTGEPADAPAPCPI